MVLAQTPHDLLNGAAPLVYAMLGFVACHSRGSWRRGSLFLLAYIAVSFRRMAQAQITIGGEHELLILLSGRYMLDIIDMLLLLGWVSILAPFPTETLSLMETDDDHSKSRIIHRPSAANWRDWAWGRLVYPRPGQRSALVGRGWFGQGQDESDDRAGVREAVVIAGDVARAGSGDVEGGTERVERRERETQGEDHTTRNGRIKTAVGYAGLIVIAASMGGLSIHFKVERDIAQRKTATLLDMRIDDIAAAFDKLEN